MSPVKIKNRILDSYKCQLIVLWANKGPIVPVVLPYLCHWRDLFLLEKHFFIFEEHYLDK